MALFFYLVMIENKADQAFSIAHPWIFIFLVSLGYVLAGIFFTGIGLLAGVFSANRWVCTLLPFAICFLAGFALQSDTAIIFNPIVYMMLDGMESISWMQYFSYLIITAVGTNAMALAAFNLLRPQEKGA